MKDWLPDAIFYHIYPLGLCGAPHKNYFSDPPTPRLDQIRPWINHMKSMGVNALNLGPAFESSAHGFN